MKQTISLLFFIFLSLTGFAQQHISFMGIPLTGTITTFHQKLVSKGIKYEASVSNSFSSGTRAFEGTFCGEDALIFVYYTPKTKVVYRAKACISSESESDVLNLYNKMYRNLRDKYPTATIVEDEFDGYSSVGFYLNLPNSPVAKGSIGLYITNDRDYYKYTLHIDYRDRINDIANEKSECDDL